MKVSNQTVLAPAITTLLFLAVFSLAWGQRKSASGLDFIEFLAPGLIMMAVLQNAFANTSSSLILSKIQGVIIDILMPPLSALEITLAYVTGGIVRGLCVGVSVAIAMLVFVDLGVHDIGLVIFYIIFSSSLLAMFGILSGVWAQSFDQVALITNYVVAPLVFLSGTFYSVKQLPNFWQEISIFNPIFYMIDGFRYAITGYSDAPVNTGLAVLIAANVICFFLCYHLINRGWRLKS